MNRILENLQKELAPLKVAVDISYNNSVYYITINGKNTYKDTAGWETNWPNGLQGFGQSILSLQKIKTQSSEYVEDGVVCFTVGSLFDLLKDE